MLILISSCPVIISRYRLVHFSLVAFRDLKVWILFKKVFDAMRRHKINPGFLLPLSNELNAELCHEHDVQQRRLSWRLLDLLSEWSEVVGQK